MNWLDVSSFPWEPEKRAGQLLVSLHLDGSVWLAPGFLRIPGALLSSGSHCALLSLLCGLSQTSESPFS